MRCWRFELDVGEWVRGRLPEKQAAAMAAHCERCDRCRRSTEAERAFRASAASVEKPVLRRDLWPELATRLDSAQTVRTRPFWVRSLRWAVAGAVAVLLGSLALRTAYHPSTTRTALARPEDEQRVVTMMANLEPIQHLDSDLTVGQYAQKIVLIGDVEP